MNIPFLSELQSLFISAFGNHIFLYLIVGLFIFLIYTGICKLNILNSLALTLGIYVIFIMYLGSGFGWLMGVAVIIYGIILFSAMRRLFNV